MATIEVAMPTQPAASSSVTITWLMRSSPLPLKRSGTAMFIRPSACAFWNTSLGKRWCSSHSAAIGAITSFANARAARWSSICSGVGVKSIMRALYTRSARAG